MDCLEGLRNMPTGSVDLVVTDPPYMIKQTKSRRSGGLNDDITKYQKELADNNLTDSYDMRILDEIFRVVKVPNIYIWCNIIQIPMYVKYFVEERKCRLDVLIWNKTNPIPAYGNKWLADKEYCLYFRKGGYCKPSNYNDSKTVWHMPINQKDKKAYGHPTIKPLPIIENIIRNSSRQGDVVLDPFMGSGTTAVAAVKNGRKYIGFENNRKFYDIALRRTNEVTI